MPGTILSPALFSRVLVRNHPPVDLEMNVLSMGGSSVIRSKCWDIGSGLTDQSNISLSAADDSWFVGQTAPVVPRPAVGPICDVNVFSAGAACLVRFMETGMQGPDNIPVQANFQETEAAIAMLSVPERIVRRMVGMFFYIEFASFGITTVTYSIAIRAD